MILVGSVRDVLMAKRLTLGGGYVGATMMVKLNKALVSVNSHDIIRLKNDEWMQHIATRNVDPPFDPDSDENNKSLSSDEDIYPE